MSRKGIPNKTNKYEAFIQLRLLENQRWCEEGMQMILFVRDLVLLKVWSKADLRLANDRLGLLTLKS